MLPTIFGSLAGASSLVVKAKLIFRANRAPIQIRHPSPSQTVLNITPHPDWSTSLASSTSRVMQLSASPLSANKQCFLLERAIVRSVLTIADVADFLPLQRVDQLFHRCVLYSTIRSLTINDRRARNPTSYICSLSAR
jgi:hypothetical protein